MNVRAFIFFLTTASLSVACATAKPNASTRAPSLGRCPSGSERARSMVENFLTNPNLSDARQETGTTGLSPDQIQLVQDESVCQKINDEFNEFTNEYAVTYYKADSFYFATQILKQPDDSNEVASGLMMIYVLDSNLNFIKGYSG